MDAGIADTINRRAVAHMAAELDKADIDLCAKEDGPWYKVSLADMLMSDDPSTLPDRAWLVGAVASMTPGMNSGDLPAGGDWENLFSYFRVEILARRNPDSSLARAAEVPALGMV